MSPAPSADRAPATLLHRDPYTLLERPDAVMCNLIRGFGRPNPLHWSVSTGRYDDRFAALVLHIISQQISTVAALGIFVKLEAALRNAVTPVAVLRGSQLTLLQCGPSHAKTASVLDVSSRIVSGSLDPERLGGLGDEDVVGALTTARGVGRWTAQMLLIHQLRRPDVFPAGDLGIHRAVQVVVALDVMSAIANVADRAAMGALPHLRDCTAAGIFAPVARS